MDPDGIKVSAIFVQVGYRSSFRPDPHPFIFLEDRIRSFLKGRIRAFFFLCRIVSMDPDGIKN